MNDASFPGPTLAQRLLRQVARSRVPHIEGLYARLGLLREEEPRLFECEFEGLRYRGCLAQHIDRHIWFFGAYEPAELHFLDYSARVMTRVGSPVSFVDIGANVGQHTLFMSRRVSTVLSFEPGEQAAEQLERNLKMNGIGNVTLVRAALGAESGTAVLGSGFPGNNGSRSLHWSLDPAANTCVPVRKGDDEFRKHGVSKVDIVKMDVEGHEKAVLAGASATLRADRPVMLFELIGTGRKSGFNSEQELRAHLYPEHELYTLGGKKKAELLPFSWSREGAVCIPAERASWFEALKT